jgi:hypothetical protein
MNSVRTGSVTWISGFVSVRKVLAFPAIVMPTFIVLYMFAVFY